uniref:Ig-like domain-containing protein n=1 Tax=Panagrellus redivivus TaxID=6233 RepID=A0A7E4UW65_PANRE
MYMPSRAVYEGLLEANDEKRMACMSLEVAAGFGSAPLQVYWEDLDGSEFKLAQKLGLLTTVTGCANVFGLATKVAHLHEARFFRLPMLQWAYMSMLCSSWAL